GESIRSACPVAARSCSSFESARRASRLAFHRCRDRHARAWPRAALNRPWPALRPRWPCLRRTPDPAANQPGRISRMAQPARDVRAANGDAPPAREDGGVPEAMDSSKTAMVQESRRYRDAAESRPAPLRIRSLRAYWTTWRVIWSYLWLRARA